METPKTSHPPIVEGILRLARENSPGMNIHRVLVVIEGREEDGSGRLVRHAFSEFPQETAVETIATVLACMEEADPDFVQAIKILAATPKA